MKNCIKNSLKASNGITLIALVITIIVLLILAGISIQMLTGDNGILTKAIDSKEKTERAEIIETAQMDILGKQAQNQGILSEQELIDILTSNDYNTKGTLSNNNEQSVLQKTLTSNGGKYQIPVSEIYNGLLISEEDSGYGLYDINTGKLKKSWEDLLAEGIIKINEYDNLITNFENNQNSSSDILDGKLKIRNDVTIIGNDAFNKCTKLKEVIIPEGVTTIGNGAFCNCSSLTKVIISDSVNLMGSGIFASCSSLTDVSLPKNGKLGYSMFAGCSSLETIVLYQPVGSTYLQGTFAGCSKLKSVNIAFLDSGFDVIDGAFVGCTSLTITVPDNVQVRAGSFGGVKQVYYNGSNDTSNWGAQNVSKSE